jgi:cell division protein FtsB
MSSAARPVVRRSGSRAHARAAPRPSTRPSTALGAAALRVRWDRVGRVALLLLLLVVVALYVAPARALLSTWRDSNAKQAQLRSLRREHAALLHEAGALRDPRTIVAEARRLGMVLPGEHPYVIRHLPRN